MIALLKKTKEYKGEGYKNRSRDLMASKHFVWTFNDSKGADHAKL